MIMGGVAESLKGFKINADLFQFMVTNYQLKQEKEI